MRIEHIAIWTEKLEELKEFYCKFFNGKSNEKYENKVKKFESYFISFESGCRLELMRRVDIKEEERKERIGFTHLAFKVEGKEKVDEMTEELRKNGYKIVGEPRTTGDGYYESVVLDPDGNRIELVG